MEVLLELAINCRKSTPLIRSHGNENREHEAQGLDSLPEQCRLLIPIWSNVNEKENPDFGLFYSTTSFSKSCSAFYMSQFCQQCVSQFCLQIWWRPCLEVYTNSFGSESFVQLQRCHAPMLSGKK